MIWWNRFKDKGALGITVIAVNTNNNAQFIDNESYVQESIVISHGANGYLFGANANVGSIGVTLGAKLPNEYPFRIRGPSSFQVGSAGAQRISVYNLLSVTPAQASDQVADIEYLLTEGGDDLLTESSQQIEIEVA